MAGGRAGVTDLRGSRLLNASDAKTALAREAQALGFDCIGVTAPDAISRAAKYFREFLDTGAHGDMDWLARDPERRADPRGLWPDVRSVIMLGVNYGPDQDPLSILKQRTRGAISVYAQGDDYHDVIKKRLKALARWLAASAQCEVKVFVDTAAVMEKPLAQASGLGWQGKHTNLVSRAFGSWLFLGAIFTTLELPPDERRGRSLRLLPGLPRHLSDGGVPRAIQARCAALHLLSHHREQGADPARISQSHRQPHLRLRRLPCGLSLEQVRARRGGRRSLPRARNCVRPILRSSRGSTMPRFARASPSRRSSVSAATASSAMC